MGNIVSFMEIVVKLVLAQLDLLEKSELEHATVASRIGYLRLAAARAEASVSMAKVAMAMKTAGCSEESVLEYREHSRILGQRAVDAVGVQEPAGLWDCI